MLAGSPLTITCDVYVGDQVDTPILVDVEWTLSGDPLDSDERVMISNATQTGYNNYRSQVDFSTLSSTMDSGNYICAFNVTDCKTCTCTFVLDANIVYDNTTLNVISELIKY